MQAVLFVVCSCERTTHSMYLRWSYYYCTELYAKAHVIQIPPFLSHFCPSSGQGQKPILSGASNRPPIGAEDWSRNASQGPAWPQVVDRE